MKVQIEFITFLFRCGWLMQLTENSDSVLFRCFLLTENVRV
jgi:hypothetical protein